jgi:hypothetical protein
MNLVLPGAGQKSDDGTFGLQPDWPFANLSHLATMMQKMSGCLLLFSCHQCHLTFAAGGHVQNPSLFVRLSRNCRKTHLPLICSVERNNEDSLLLCGGPGKDEEKLWELCCTQSERNSRKRFTTFGKHQQT